MKKKLLSGHTSPETAFVVNDYPYGRTVRCTIRYWIEFKKGHGYRFCHQTTNPNRGNIWNKPKYSTYTTLGLLYQIDNPGADDHGHVKWAGYGFWISPEQWFEVHGDFYDQMAPGEQRAFRAAWRISFIYDIGGWQIYWKTKGVQILARKLTLDQVEDAYLIATSATPEEAKEKLKAKVQPNPSDVTKWVESLPNS